MFVTSAYLSNPAETFALDTTKPRKGAPGFPGELRAHLHPTNGFQVYRLVLNESTASTVVGKHYLMAVGSVNGPAINDVGVAATPVIESAGVAQSIAADDEWTWLLVYGRGTVLAGGTTITGTDTIEFDAAGAFLDGSAAVGTRAGTALGVDITNGTTGTAFVKLI